MSNQEPKKEANVNEKKKKKQNPKWIMTKVKVQSFFKKYFLLPYIAIGIALFFLSMLLTAQMKNVSDTEKFVQGKTEAQLSEDLLSMQRKYNDLKEKYDANQKVVEEYQTNSSSNNSLIKSMKKENEELKTLSGTTDLKGEGIVITLNDGSNLTASSGDDASYLVHDSYLLTIVNELKAAGAEAISVNDQRIIATSAIRCVGPVIQVNYQKVGAPFVVRAIGNAQYLESAMNIKNGIVDMLKATGVDISVKREVEVSIPKFDGALTFKNAVEANNK